MVLDRVFAWAQGLGASDAGEEVVAHEMAADASPACASAGASPGYRLLVVPALSDNYMYVVLPTRARGRAVAVDVSAADLRGAERRSRGAHPLQIGAAWPLLEKLVLSSEYLTPIKWTN